MLVERASIPLSIMLMSSLLSLCAGLLLCSTASAAVTDQAFNQLKQSVTAVNNLVAGMQKTVDTQRNVITALARQVSQQQLHVEEATRSYGDSGLKLTRLTRTGSKSYFSTSFADNKVAAIHDHSNYRGTVGMGELVAVLNGVEFRTRHNDYKMRMPSRTSTKYGATEDVPYPQVPPQVLAKPTIQQQIDEMREWFKAWKNSDHSRRDYRKYFKANLCYLEGQWTNAKSGAIDEPFASDRHAIDAKSFFDLQSKIKFTAVTGRKSTKENYAYLPTTISDVDEHGNIIYSQWNYQILCHPLKRHIPLTRFRLEEDLAPRVANGKTREAQFTERAARFSLYEDLRDTSSPSQKDVFNRDFQGRFLDRLMAEIPGKDNYPAKIVDNAFGEIAYKVDANITAKPPPLNVGFYHNAYKVNRADAMGSAITRRGFSDANLYLAYTNQAKVALSKVVGRCVRIYNCTKYLARTTGCETHNCPEYSARVSYAIPLEIIYTTPLQSWNPYKLARFSGKENKKPQLEKKVKNLNRNGEKTKERAYYGASDIYYYLTPSEFYENTKKGGKTDKADTVRRNDVGVLDKSGNVKMVMQSGISIMTKDIPDIGPMRIRYPVMPIHDYGNVIYKNLEALTDMTLKQAKYQKLYPDFRSDNGTIEEVFTFETRMTTNTPPGIHLHTLEVSLSDIEAMKGGKAITFVTSSNSGHTHEILVSYNKQHNIIRIHKCDGQWGKCWDGHIGKLTCPDCRFGYPVA